MFGEIENMVKRYMAIRYATSGRYSEFDGSIYYLSDLTGEQVLWRAYREPQGYRYDLVLPWDRRINSYRISPAGYISFSTDVDGDEHWSIYIARGDSIKLVCGENNSINNLGEWSPSGRFLSYSSNARNGVDFDLYVYDLISGRSTMILKNDGMIIPSKWIDDNLLLAVKMNTYQDTDLILVRREDGGSINLTRHSGEALNTSPIAIDNRFLIFITNQEREFTGIALYDLEKRVWRYIATEEWDIEKIDYMDGRIAYVVNEDGASIIKIYTLEDKRSREAVRIWGVVEDIDLYSGGMVLSINSPKYGQEVFILNDMGVLERVTYSPRIGVSEESFISPEIFRYRSFDGLEIHGLLYRPREPAGDKPPAVIYLHGGPESQERVVFNRVQQALLSLGIAIVSPNYRGSSGYGKTFIHLDDVDKRIGAVYDVYHAIEHLSGRGDIDPARLCVMGASYGGYLTLMMLTQYPDLWRCGVEIVGIVNLITFIRNTGAWRRKYRITEYGDPDIHGDIMIKLSPISYIDRIKAPLMIIHGARDPRVPVSEAEQLVNALRNKGIEVRYIRLEDEGHGISKVRNRIRVYSEAIRFIYEKLVSSTA